MNQDFYKKLVDLYAADELPTELKEELEAAAFGDQELSHDMSTLKTTVNALQNLPAPEFTEESFERVLMKLYARGVDVQPKSPPSPHLQYRLPMPG